MSIDLVIVFVIQNKFSFRYHLVFVGEKNVGIIRQRN